MRSSSTEFRAWCFRSSAFVMMAALAASAGTIGCNTDLIINAIPNGHHQANTGGSGTGGSSTGFGTGGSSGTGIACSPIVAVPGVSNPCGRMPAVAYSKDGQLFAAGRDSSAPNVYLWSVAGGILRHTLTGAPSGILSVAFSPDGTLIASGGKSDSPADLVHIWNTSSGLLVRTLPLDPQYGIFYASSVAFSHDGALIATAGVVGPVELWRVSDGVRVMAIPYPTSIHNVHFSPDDSKLIVGGVDERATVWSVPAGTLTLTLTGTAGEMADADFSPDGQRIASTGVGNVIKIWDAGSGMLMQTLVGHDQFVSHVLWVGNDRLVTDDWSGIVKMWAVGAIGSSVSNTWNVGAQALGLALSPDHTRIAVGADNGIAFLVP